MIPIFNMVEEQLNGFNTHYAAEADPRVAKWALMKDFKQVLLISLIYIYFVKYLGPKIMMLRKPFVLKNIMIAYNMVQISCCFMIFYLILISGWTTKLTLGCEPIHFSDDPNDIRMASYVWWTMLLKLFEFIETIFFVLRKKHSQVSALHIYHHVSTVFLTWAGTKYLAGGMTTFYIMLNCIVHIIMYTYYLVTVLQSNNIWLKRIKKYITILQMGQFCIMLAHSSQALSPECPIPNILPFILMADVIIVFYLFIRFYRQTYNKNTQQSQILKDL